MGFAGIIRSSRLLHDCLGPREAPSEPGIPNKGADGEVSCGLETRGIRL